MKLYVYAIETREHLLTITGNNAEECEAEAIDLFDSDAEYRWTYTPNFGQPEGLKRNTDKLKAE